MNTTEQLLAILIGVLVIFVARWTFGRRRSLRLFSELGIPGPEPSFLSGNLSELTGEHHNYVISRWIKTYGDVFGYYQGEAPYLVIKDLEMQKQVFIKDFHSFRNRPNLFVTVEPIDTTLLSLRDRRWKEIRSILTPNFSSGKMKLFTDIVNKKVDITMDVVNREAENKMFDIYDVFQRLTLDVIADCALAMKTDCLTNPKDKFLNAARNLTSILDNPAIQLIVIFPFLTKILEKFVPYHESGKLIQLVMQNVHRVIRKRTNDKETRSMDFLQLMLDCRENDQVENGGPAMSDAEIAANAFMFLVAGYETTSTAMAFTIYLLVTHPEIQEKLYQEIEEAEDSSYKTVQNLQYMDQVFNESLRLYPPITGLVARECSEDIQVGSIRIPKGTNVTSPVWDIHRDPDLWPDPLKFDPDRFAPENKSRIKNLSFQAFGVGPRNCIGARFAQLEAKLSLFRLIKRFKFEKCEKTEETMILKNMLFTSQPANGVWVRAMPRI